MPLNPEIVEITGGLNKKVIYNATFLINSNFFTIEGIIQDWKLNFRIIDPKPINRFFSLASGNFTAEPNPDSEIHEINFVLESLNNASEVLGREIIFWETEAGERISCAISVQSAEEISPYSVYSGLIDSKRPRKVTVTFYSSK